MSKEATHDEILKAAMDLFSKKGFEGVATAEIAKKSGVSEMTLFRHFGTKLNVFRKVYKKYVFSPNFSSFLENELQWDLEKDLLKLSLNFQNALTKSKKIIQMLMKTTDSAARSRSPLLEIPAEHRRLLIRYFSEMQAQGKVVKIEPEILAMNFMAMNFGLFSTHLLLGKSFNKFDMEALISNHIAILAKGLDACKQRETRPKKNVSDN